MLEEIAVLASLFQLARKLVPAAYRPEVEIHGAHSPDWMNALGPDGPVWRLLPRIGAVRLEAGSAHFHKRIVIPLMEPHIRTMPGSCWALVPDAAALAVFSDKLAFARYVEQQGLGAFAPETLDLAAPSFPAVLKRTDLNAGNGIVVVASREELDIRLAQPLWSGHAALLQELVGSRTDYVTHLVAAGGRIVWHRTYAYKLNGRRVIRGAVERLETHPAKLSAADIAILERFLLPLGFDGPANVDFRRRKDGRLAVLEINPAARRLIDAPGKRRRSRRRAAQHHPPGQMADGRAGTSVAVAADQDFALAGMVGGRDHALLFHPLDQARRLVVADGKPALHIGGRGLLVLQHDVDGLVVKLVARAGIIAVAGGAVGVELFVLGSDRIEIVGRALALEMPHHILDFDVGNERAVQAPDAAAAGHVEHVAIAEQLFGALLTENGAAVDL